MTIVIITMIKVLIIMIIITSFLQIIREKGEGKKKKVEVEKAGKLN